MRRNSELRQVWCEIDEDGLNRIESQGQGSHRHIVGSKAIPWEEAKSFANAKVDRFVNIAA